MNMEFIGALTELCKEKGIGEEVILDALEAAMVAAYKRNFNSAQNVEVHIDRDEGQIQVLTCKEVVEDMTELDPQYYIPIDEAKKINAAYTAGDIVRLEVTPKNFGRIAAMTAKQVVTQRLREAERGIIYSEYTEKINNLVTGSIERIERGVVYVDIGKMEAVLPPSEQPPGETYEVHQTVLCYVADVKNGARGTQILLSRTNPGLVRKLFEREVPEIADGTVEIRGVSREAGSRTKIAVSSNVAGVDAQGSCIGPRGMRVQNVSDELNNEKIDIIKWSEDPSEYISAALSPSKVIKCTVNELEKTARVVVPDNQLSLAIGKAGQNVRLAARLTGWKIDIISDAQKDDAEDFLDEDEFDIDDEFGDEFEEDEYADADLDMSKPDKSRFDTSEFDGEFDDEFNDEFGDELDGSEV